MSADPSTVPTAPPDAARLAALDDDLWRRVVIHLRRSLAVLAREEDHRWLRRLAAAPTSRLVSGRTRRDAATALAEGGELWLDLRRRVVADPDLAESFAAALRAPAAAAARPAAASRPAPDTTEAERLRERLRRTRDERDRARRRAEGESARADREGAARREAETQLARARERGDDLERQLAAADDQRAAAVDRERRRGAAALAETTEQLRELRREQQDRARQERAAVQAEEARAARAAAPAPAPPAPPRLVPGRPSRLPEPVRPDTTEAVDLLLHAGRRVLVDGYNVTRTHRDDLDLEGQRRWLVNLVAGAAAARRIEPRIVFDGHGSQGPGSMRRDRGVEVAFTPESVTADDDLVFEVEAADPMLPIVVVTDDRELRARLGPYGVDVVSTQGFLDALR